MMRVFFKWAVLPIKSMYLILSIIGGCAYAATYSSATTTYNWIDPATHTKVGYNTSPYKFNSCGTTVPTLDDTISDVIPIGWNFLYGATTYNSLRIESNGRLQFANANCTNGTQSIGPPQTYTYLYPNSNMNNTMKAFGVDLDPTNLVDKPNYPTSTSKTSCTSSATCYIAYASIGTSPRRQFVVSWVNVPEWVTSTNTSGSFTFQIILNEDGSFIYQYKAIVHGGTGKAQVGWQLSTTDYDVLTFGASTEPGAPTAILFYIPSGNPFAEYRFEEGAWAASLAGQVQDSSSNALHGSVLGSAQEIAPSKVCRGANIPSNTSAGTVDAIKTGLRFSDPGVNMVGQGTILFWYNANSAWNNGTAAQLIDATLANGQWFYLTKTGTGTLYFQVTDSSGTLRSVETAAQTFIGNTWVHIAISWNFNASPTANSDHLQIFIDGAAPTVSAFTSSGSLPTLDYVHAGDNPSGFVGTKGTVNSANGILDELRFYNSELNQGQVLGIRGVTRTCSTYTVDHLELRHASWSGNACAPSTITVAACANGTAGPTCTPYTQGIVATMSGSGVVWDATAGGATIVIPYGQSTATRNFYAAAGTTTLGLTGTGNPVAPLWPSKCIVGSTSGSCTWTTANGGLVLTVPNSGVILGNKPTAVTLQAVQASGSTPAAACVPVQNLSATGLKLWSTPTNPTAFAATSSSASVTVGGTPQVLNPGTGTYVYTPTSVPVSNNVTGLNFDAAASTAISLKHVDTGQFDLNATLNVAATSSAPALTLTGAATVKAIPVGYGVSASTVAAPSGTQTACATFPSAACDTSAGAAARVASAGDAFSSTVIASLWTADADTDLTDNPVAPSYVGDVTLSTTLVAPDGGTTGGLGTTTATLAAGAKTVSGQTWSQSGAMKIVASGTYLSQSIAGQSVVLGRFSPKNFTTSMTTAGCGTFTYSGQPMTVVTVNAMVPASPSPVVTPNYKGDFARLTTLSDATASATGSLTANTIAAAGFVNGVGTASPVYKFTNRATAPVPLTLRATDGEITSSGFTEASAPIRSGRVRLTNAYDSERRTTGLLIPVTIEYYDTVTAPGWRAGPDACTNLDASNFAFTAAAPACSAAIGNCTTALSATRVGAGPYTWTVNLSQPSPVAATAMCITLNLDGAAVGSQCTATGAPGPAATSANAPWLRFGWRGATETNPTAAATFGVFRSPLIYRRENY